jgi:DNA-binding NarL/FixJ family response regulator
MKELKLTDREKEVLVDMCRRCSDEQIAHKFNITVATVRWHIHNMVEKFDLRDRSQLIVYAIKELNID